MTPAGFNRGIVTSGNAGSLGWVLDDEGLVEPPGCVGASVLRGSEHSGLLLVGLEADLAELRQPRLDDLLCPLLVR